MSQDFDTEKWAEEKQNEKSKTYEMLEKETDKVVSNNNEFKKYLDVQSKFINNFNVANALLVTNQMPEATLLRDAEGWFRNRGRLKDDRKSVVLLNQNGTYINENGEQIESYTTKKYYDISQVRTAEKQDKTRYNNKFLYQTILNGFSSANENLEFEIVKDAERLPSGKLVEYIEEEHKFYITFGTAGEMPSNQDMQEIVEEIAKYKLSQKGDIDSFKVQCVSYMICKKYNIDVSNYEFEVPFYMKNKELVNIRNDLKSIVETSKEMNNEIAREIAEVVVSRERNVKENSKER